MRYISLQTREGVLGDGPFSDAPPIPASCLLRPWPPRCSVVSYAKELPHARGDGPPLQAPGGIEGRYCARVASPGCFDRQARSGTPRRHPRAPLSISNPFVLCRVCTSPASSTHLGFSRCTSLGRTSAISIPERQPRYST